MARSFWSKRSGQNVNGGGANNRRRSVLVTIAGIILVGLLLFGIFQGTRWAYQQLTDGSSGSDTAQTDTAPAEPGSSAPESTPSPSTPPAQDDGGAITETSSRSTNQPSTAATTPTQPQQQPQTGGSLPNTGAESYGGVFLLTSIAGYLIYRVRLARNHA